MSETNRQEGPPTPNEECADNGLATTQNSMLRRLESAFGPIIAGVLFDVMDLRHLRHPPETEMDMGPTGWGILHHTYDGVHSNSDYSRRLC